MAAAELLIRSLGGSIASGMCRCPAHDDDHPSLHVANGDNGKLLVHCHAGCSQEEVLAALKAQGWWPSDNRRPASKPSKSAEQERREKFRNQAYPILRTTMKAALIGAGRYQAPVTYLRGRGIEIVPRSIMLLPRKEAAALRERIPGFKGFPAMVLPICGPKGLQGASVTFLSRDGSKNLRSANDNKHIRRNYGTVKGGYAQLGVIDPDQPPERVIVAEGIETALSAAQLTGYPAIAVLGANNYASITPPPCGELIVAADNNEVGKQKAKAAAALWAASGRRVRIAVPPEHNDWNDAHRDRNADPRQLKQLLLNGKRVKAKAEIRALSMEEVIALQIPASEFLVEPWLTTGSLAMMQAKRGVGKTRLAMAVSHAIACGNQFLSWNVPRKARVLYVDGELPTALLQKRLRELGTPTDNLCIVSRDILLSRGLTLPDLGQLEGREFLDRIIEQEQSQLIVLDSLSTLIRSGVENEAESWAPIQDWLLGHRFRNRSIVFLHHEGRSGQARGTTKREDALDTIIRLQLMEQDDADAEETTLKLSFEKKREFYGSQAASLILHLSTRDGRAAWSHELERDHSRERVQAMQREGMKAKDIAKALNLSPSWVSRLLSQPAGRD